MVGIFFNLFACFGSKARGNDSAVSGGRGSLANRASSALASGISRFKACLSGPADTRAALDKRVGRARVPRMVNIKGWKMTGAQLGSNAGGQYVDEENVKWYCKFSRDKDSIMNELLAMKFYEMLGAKVPTVQLIKDHKGRLGIASKWQDDVKPAGLDQLAVAPGACQGFMFDVWLANWDVVGSVVTNLLLDGDGKAVRIDGGGALLYRAQGGLKGKQFDERASEFESLRNPKVNPQAAAVFSQLKHADIRAGCEALARMTNEVIQQLVCEFGPDKRSKQRELINKLIARRDHLLAKAESVLKHQHPRRDDAGAVVALTSPSVPSAVPCWTQSNAIATVVPDGALPAQLNGIELTTWRAAPDSNEAWQNVSGQLEFDEPVFEPPQDKKAAAGVLILEKDGRVWLVSPSNAFGGYTTTLPKGRPEDGASLQVTAIREAFEESGLQVKITGFLTDALRGSTYTRYYLAERIGGTPADMGWESQAVHLVPRADLDKVLTHPNDQPLIAAIHQKLKQMG